MNDEILIFLLHIVTWNSASGAFVYIWTESAMEPRFSEVPRDWGNLFLKSKVRYIEHFHLTNFRENYQNVRYIEVRGGTPGNSSWGCAAPFFKFWPYFRPKKCNFLHPFSHQTSKIHIPFKTWSLGRNYVISTRLGKQTLGLGLGLIIQIHFEFAYFSFFLTYLKLKREIRSYTP